MEGEALNDRERVRHVEPGHICDFADGEHSVDARKHVHLAGPEWEISRRRVDQQSRDMGLQCLHGNEAKRLPFFAKKKEKLALPPTDTTEMRPGTGQQPTRAGLFAHEGGFRPPGRSWIGGHR